MSNLTKDNTLSSCLFYPELYTDPRGIQIRWHHPLFCWWHCKFLPECCNKSSLMETMKNIPTYALDVKAPWWFQRPPGPAVPEDLEVNLFALDQQHMLIDPAKEEDLGQRLCQRLVPEMLHVDGFKVGEDLVAAVMLQVDGRRYGSSSCGRWWWWWWWRRRWQRWRRPLSNIFLPANLRQHESQRVRGNMEQLLHVLQSLSTWKWRENFLLFNSTTFFFSFLFTSIQDSLITSGYFVTCLENNRLQSRSESAARRWLEREVRDTGATCKTRGKQQQPDTPSTAANYLQESKSIRPLLFPATKEARTCAAFRCYS